MAKKILYWLDMTFEGDMKKSHPGPTLPADTDTSELAQKYLVLSQKGTAFPGLQSLEVRPATEAEIESLRDRRRAQSAMKVSEVSE